jgi:hypothetical protein
MKWLKGGGSILLLIDEIFVSSFIDDQCNQLKITFECENVPCGCAVLSRRLDKIDPKVTGTPEFRERNRVKELFKTRYGAQTQASKYFGTNATFLLCKSLGVILFYVGFFFTCQRLSMNCKAEYRLVHCFHHLIH